jgi:hypothetical protein
MLSNLQTEKQMTQKLEKIDYKTQTLIHRLCSQTTDQDLPQSY